MPAERRAPDFPTREICAVLAPAPPVAAADTAEPVTVSVPVEPTEKMLIAARDWSYAKYYKPIGNDAAIGCWKAMIAAAQGGE